MAVNTLSPVLPKKHSRMQTLNIAPVLNIYENVVPDNRCDISNQNSECDIPIPNYKDCDQDNRVGCKLETNNNAVYKTIEIVSGSATHSPRSDSEAVVTMAHHERRGLKELATGSSEAGSSESEAKETVAGQEIVEADVPGPQRDDTLNKFLNETDSAFAGVSGPQKDDTLNKFLNDTDSAFVGLRDTFEVSKVPKVAEGEPTPREQAGKDAAHGIVGIERLQDGAANSKKKHLETISQELGGGCRDENRTLTQVIKDQQEDTGDTVASDSKAIRQAGRGYRVKPPAVRNIKSLASFGFKPVVTSTQHSPRALTDPVKTKKPKCQDCGHTVSSARALAAHRARVHERSVADMLTPAKKVQLRATTKTPAARTKPVLTSARSIKNKASPAVTKASLKVRGEAKSSQKKLKEVVGKIPNTNPVHSAVHSKWRETSPPKSRKISPRSTMKATPGLSIKKTPNNLAVKDWKHREQCPKPRIPQRLDGAQAQSEELLAEEGGPNMSAIDELVTNLKENAAELVTTPKSARRPPRRGEPGRTPASTSSASSTPSKRGREEEEEEQALLTPSKTLVLADREEDESDPENDSLMLETVRPHNLAVELDKIAGDLEDPDVSNLNMSKTLTSKEISDLDSQELRDMTDSEEESNSPGSRQMFMSEEETRKLAKKADQERQDKDAAVMLADNLQSELEEVRLQNFRLCEEYEKSAQEVRALKREKEELKRQSDLDRAENEKVTSVMVQTAVSDRESEMEEEQLVLTYQVKSLEEEMKRLTEELREAKIAAVNKDKTVKLLEKDAERNSDHAKRVQTIAESAGNSLQTLKQRVDELSSQKEKLTKLLPCLCKARDCEKNHNWIPKDQRICPFFSRGNCRYGSKCRDKHERAEGEPAARARDHASRSGQGSRSAGRVNHHSRSPAPRRRGNSRRRDSERAASDRRGRGSDSSDWRRREHDVDEAIRAGIEAGLRRMKSSERGGRRKKSRSKSRPRGRDRGAEGERKKDRGSTSKEDSKGNSSSSSSRPEDIVSLPSSTSAGNEKDQERADQAPGQKKVVPGPKGPRGRGQRHQKKGGAEQGEGGSSGQSAQPRSHVSEKILEQIKAARTPMAKHLQGLDAAKQKATIDKRVKEVMKKIDEREEQKRLDRQMETE